MDEKTTTQKEKRVKSIFLLSDHHKRLGIVRAQIGGTFQSLVDDAIERQLERLEQKVEN